MTPSSVFGVAWVDGRPQTARAFKGRIHRQWVEFALGIATYWPNPLNAQRVCVITVAERWTEDPVRTATRLDQLMRNLAPLNP